MADHYFSGIGGIGMSALAQIVKAEGHNVIGSDRNYDRGLDPELFSKLKMLGINLAAQNGSGVYAGLSNVVVSSAIEDDNPDVKAAKEKGVNIVTRSDLLADIFNDKFGIAIGGSNGKTSVTAMTGWALDRAGLDPTIMVGGYIKNHVTDTNPGNARTGKSKYFAIEADESDGSIVNYKPRISVITSISKDHKTVEELLKLFEIFADNTIGLLIINADCPEAGKIGQNRPNVITYGIENGADTQAVDIKHFSWGSSFCSGGALFKLNLPGLFNIYNALAVISIARELKIKDEKTASALESFKGAHCRMDVIGEARGIRVINDYAHNPEKIKSAIDALKFAAKRLIVIFQPHGYGPTRFMKDELIDSFTSKMSENDILLMPEIYYAGGTAKKDISSNDIIKILKKNGLNADYFENRSEITGRLKSIAKPGDVVVVMGARDNSLPNFCHEIVDMLKCLESNSK